MAVRTYAWEVAAAAAVAGKLVVDGAAPFPAKTLLVETKIRGNPPVTPFDRTGAVVFQFEGLGPPAWYSRRFALGAWGAVSVHIEQFRNYTLRILSNTVVDFDVVAMASDGDEASSQPVLVYPETITAAAGAGVVPWGAVEMIPGAADAGFAWEAAGVTIPVALTAGVTYSVAGVRYVPSVFPFSAVWRIRP